MSWGDDPDQGDQADTAGLRVLAHPIRLRMLSLLTSAAMTAAELARELDITHANASYHLRQLLAAGQIELVGQERIHGGTAKRYRYVLEHGTGPPPEGPERYETQRLVYAALTTELQRRAQLRGDGSGHLTDAELWVEPEVWEAVRDQVTAASDALHQAARPPRTAGTVRVNATMVLFPMESGG